MMIAPTKHLLPPMMRQTLLLLMRARPHTHLTLVIYQDTFTGRLRASLEIRRWAAKKWITWAAAKNQIRAVYSSPATGEDHFVFGFKIDD